MTKVEELRAASKLANEELSAARTKANDAARALMLAEIEETGLLGHMVERKDGVRFVVEKRGWMTGYVKGSMIKKDGTRGERQIECRADQITDMGEYTEK